MHPSPVTLSMRGPVALVSVDDGADNSLDMELLNALLVALHTAQAEARAVVIAGRPGVFSVGIDPDTLDAGGKESADMLHLGTDLILRIVESPRPMVAACTGHALGAAAVSLMASDVRIGRAGDFEIGLDWVSRGWKVPGLAIDLARIRLSPRHFTLACNTAQIYSPEEAVAAGFLDSVTDGDVVESACEVAADMAERLHPRAFEGTRATTCRWLRDAVVHAAGELYLAQQSGRVG